MQDEIGVYMIIMILRYG